MILIEIDEKIGTYTQKKPIFNYLTPICPWDDPEYHTNKKVLYHKVSIDIFIHMK